MRALFPPLFFSFTVVWMTQEKRFFRVLVGETEAEGKVSSIIRSRKWTDFHVEASSITYTPYWFFSFDIYEDSGGKTRVLERGASALNSFTRNLDESVVAPELHGVEKEEKVGHRHEHKIVGSRVEEAEARQLIPVLLASKHDASKDCVILSGFEFAYLPVWNVVADLHVKKVEFQVNAVTGRVVKEPGLEERDRGEKELLAETLEELSRPSEWLRYASEILSGFFSRSKAHGADGQNSLLDKKAQVLVLAIIAVLTVIWFFFLK